MSLSGEWHNMGCSEHSCAVYTSMLVPGTDPPAVLHVPDLAIQTPSIHTSGRSFVKPYVLVNDTEARIVLINKGSQGPGTTVTLSLRGRSSQKIQPLYQQTHSSSRVC
jgi:hypothetical protein